MITLSLLHPVKKIPVQNWTFENEPIIRIGRSTDNHVVLYSAVVSRHHVDLRRKGAQWEIINLGTNGTYMNGKRITQVIAEDGAVIRLARSGPNIQIRLGADAFGDEQQQKAGQRLLERRSNAVPNTAVLNSTPDSSSLHLTQGVIPVPPHLRLVADSPAAVSVLDHQTTEPRQGATDLAALAAVFEAKETLRSAATTLLRPRMIDAGTPVALLHQQACLHPRQGPLFCLDCGQPLHSLMAIANYEIIGGLGQTEVSTTYWAWQKRQNVVLKTLNPNWIGDAAMRLAFQQEAERLYALNHPQFPQFLDYFQVGEQPYLVRELIPGQTLAQQIQQHGPVREAQAARWLLQVCQILDHLHQQSPAMLHGHITPEVLLVRAIPQAGYDLALIDFGLIRVDGLRSDWDMESAVYLAPEVRQGQIETGSDLYSLGPILIYLLTGQNPSLYYGNRDQGQRLYAEYVPGLSAGMTRIIRVLTDPRPEHRYPSALALATELRSLLATVS